MTLMKYYYFEREAAGENPAGWTVSKAPRLPDGDFVIEEFCWPGITLWFVAVHEFTDDERQEAMEGFKDAIMTREKTT